MTTWKEKLPVTMIGLCRYLYPKYKHFLWQKEFSQYEDKNIGSLILPFYLPIFDIPVIITLLQQGSEGILGCPKVSVSANVQNDRGK